MEHVHFIVHRENAVVGRMPIVLVARDIPLVSRSTDRLRKLRLLSVLPDDCLVQPFSIERIIKLDASRFFHGKVPRRREALCSLLLL